MKDACVQASLCNCNMKPLVAFRDECEQTSLCHCSEFVMNSAANHQSAVEAALECEHDSEVHISKLPSAVVAENRAVRVKVISEEQEMADVEAICKELEECDLDDTVEYDYTCQGLPPVGISSSVDEEPKLLPLQHQPENYCTEAVRLSGNLFSESYNKSSHDTASLDDTSLGDKTIDDVFESGVPTELGTEKSAESMLAVAPDQDDSLDDTSLGDKIVDDVFELEVVKGSTEKSAEPTLELEDREDPNNENQLEILSDESEEQDESPTVPHGRKVLTSTTIGNPDTAFPDFFGVAISSVSSGEKEPKLTSDDGRRKSKGGSRRVSMCGLYVADSPTTFFTPVATKSSLTAIADTDEEVSDTTAACLYKTAVYDTASDDADSEQSSELDADEVIPDSPDEGSEPSENKSCDGSVPSVSHPSNLADDDIHEDMEPDAITGAAIHVHR